MTYEEAGKLMNDNLKIVETVGNENFPYFIDRLLIMPSKRNKENELCIIKWVIFNGAFFKDAFNTCEITEDDFNVYVYTKIETMYGLRILPIPLSEYLS
jgi:hypothetical protein